MIQNPRNLVGPELRRIRIRKKLSQPKLAVILQCKGWDVSRDTLAKIEGQTRWVSDFEAAFLAAALEVSLEELFPRRELKATLADYITRLEKSY